jgi:hypothetical protein
MLSVQSDQMLKVTICRAALTIPDGLPLAFFFFLIQFISN